MGSFKKWSFVLLNGSIYVFCFAALYFTSQLPQSTNKIDVGSGFFPKIVLWLIIITNTIVLITDIVAKKRSSTAEQSIKSTETKNDMSKEGENGQSAVANNHLNEEKNAEVTQDEEVEEDIATEKQNVKTNDSENEIIQDSTSVVRFITIVSILIIYIYSWNIIDYKISTAILAIVIMYMLTIRSWKILTFVTAGMIASIYVFFEVIMRIPMP